MNRMEAFLSLEEHAWLGRIFKRLSKSELQIAKDFIQSHESTPQQEFEFAVNRMFLGKADKPKNYTMILELLSCANTQQANKRI